jgi:hypothetical protein
VGKQRYLKVLQYMRKLATLPILFFIFIFVFKSGFFFLNQKGSSTLNVMRDVIIFVFGVDRSSTRFPGSANSDEVHQSESPLRCSAPPPLLVS